jgi:hypothetical protein
LPRDSHFNPKFSITSHNKKEKQMRKLLIIAIGAALAFSLTASATASAEEPVSGSEEPSPISPSEARLAGCEALLVCAWSETEFKGAEGRTMCAATGFHPFAQTKHSIINDCSSRAVFLRYKGAYNGTCLEHETQDKNNLFDEIRIGEVNTHC